MNSPLVLHLGDPLATDATLTGGKGSRLASLRREGFPVPDALIVTSSAYHRFVADLPHDTAPERFREMLETHPLPAELEASIRTHLAAFAEQALAVRSSSTMEDLAESAFAGQHETFLNVRGEDQVIEHVRRCFLSLWNERAISYRTQRGFDHRAARMAVVIQRLIPCEVAGVAFSLDPVSGDSNRILIDANHGLGESVVGGETGVDHWVLDRGSLAVTEASIALKTEKTVTSVDGVRTESIHSAGSCLDDSQLREVAELVLAVESAARFPQDIEWGFADGKLWLLQARAITTLPPRWTREESAERFPNPITPLTWEFVDSGFHDSLAWSLRLMGMPPCHGRWFASFDHYIYGNQNLVEMYCRRLPFSFDSLDDLVSLVPRLREEFHWAQQLPVDWMRDLDGYLLAIGKATATDLDSLDDRALWLHAQGLVRHGSDYFLPNIAISITHGLLCRLLHRLVTLVVPDGEAPALFQSLLAWGNTKTSQINRELHEIAAMVRTNAELVRLLEEVPSGEFHRTGLARKFPQFASRFDKFLDDHGHRETDFDIYHAPWGDAPWVVLDHLRALLRTAATNGHDAERAAKFAAHEAEQRFLSSAPAEWRFFFSEVLRLARVYTQLDDLEHYQTTRLNRPLRRALGELGRRFQAKGILEAPMDIIFAGCAQIEEALDESSDPQTLAAAIRRQKSAYEAACQREPGWTPHDEDQPIAAGNGTLQGLPGSPGTAEGIIYHVRGPEDFAGFPAGAVLVSRTTNPAWTPLFHLAAAVVTESGGPLSHGAVTARELGIPAVMSVLRCLSLLPQGTRVRVDGLRGLVMPA